MNMLQKAAIVLVSVVFTTLPIRAEMMTFEDAGKPGDVPVGFTQATTGKGVAANWKLQEVPGAPSGKLVVGQLSAGGDMRFPVLVNDKFNAADVELSVKFKAIAGKDDQAAGLVWRYQDANNYYVVRANALEDNVVLYIVSNGRRIDLPVKGKGRTYGAKAPIKKAEWNTLAVSAKGTLFQVSLNGAVLYEVEDRAIAKPGKVGLWTKADSIMQFDDFFFDLAK